jgi:DNA-binding protein HU-beta
MAATKKKTKTATAVPTASTSSMIDTVASKFSDITKKMAKDVVIAFLETIESHVSKGMKVRIDKLGIMQMKDRAARKGRNPQTGEEIKIPASKKVSFRVSSSLKEAVGIQKKKTTTTAAKAKTATTKKKK